MIKTETVVGVFDTDKGLTSVATPSGVGQTYLMSYNPTTGLITDPAQRAAVGAAALIPAHVARSKGRVPLKMIASPPTVTISTTNPLSAGFFWDANQNGTGAGAGPSAVSLFGGGYWANYGASYPDHLFIKGNDVTTATPGSYNNVSMRICTVYTGSRVVFFAKGLEQTIFIKVNDEFVSLSGHACAGGGALQYVDIQFAASGTYTIEIIGLYLFGGVYTSLTDSLSPAPRVGPRTVVVADSFGTGTGNEVSNNLNWVTYLSEALGWNDITSSAVGGTGLVNPGTVCTFGARMAHDVYPLKPDLVWVSTSINDNSYTAAQCSAALTSLITDIRANLPNATIVVSSPTNNRGAGWLMNSAGINLSYTYASVCASLGVPYLDDSELPLSGGLTPHTVTLSSAASANATTLALTGNAIPGATYKAPNGAKVFVRSSSGSNATVDNLAVALSAGTTLTQCGQCYLWGNGSVGNPTGWGNTDLAVTSASDVHPKNYGHKLKGLVDAGLLQMALAP